MVCSKCGSQLPEGTKICSVCGAQLSSDEDQKKSASQEVKRVPNIPRRAQDPLPERPAQDKKSLGIGCLSVFLITAVVIVVII